MRVLWWQDLCLAFHSPTKVLARTTSNVVTPNNFLGLYTPAFFSTYREMRGVKSGLEYMLVGLCERMLERVLKDVLDDVCINAYQLGKVENRVS